MDGRCVLVRAVTSKQPGTLHAVLQNIEAHRSDDTKDVALIPVGPNGVTALQAAAAVEDGKVACMLLSSPGIASPSAWYRKSRGVVMVGQCTLSLFDPWVRKTYG